MTPRRLVILLTTTFTLIASPCLAATISFTYSPAQSIMVPIGMSETIDIDATVTGAVPFGWGLGRVAVGPGFTSIVVVAGCNHSATTCDIQSTFTPTDTTPSTITYAFHAVNSSGAILASGDGSLTATGIANTPLPAALPLFATGLGALGLLGWRRKRKAQAAA